MMEMNIEQEKYEPNPTILSYDPVPKGLYWGTRIVVDKYFYRGDFPKMNGSDGGQECWRKYIVFKTAMLMNINKPIIVRIP